MLNCSTENGADLPESVEALENVTVYSAEEKPKFDIHLQEENTIGNTSEVVLGNLSSFDVDRNNRVFIGDSDQNKFFIFDSEGNYLQSLGQEGRGPGEFINIGSFSIQHDQLFATDFKLQRVHVFSLDSLSLLQTIPLQQEEQKQAEELNDSFLHSLFVREDSTLLMGFSKPFQLDNPDDKKIVYYAANHEGKLTSDKLLEHKDSKHLVSENPDGPTIALKSPFHGKPLLSMSSEELLYLTDTKDFLIEVYDVNGNYKRAIYHPFKNKELSREEALNHPENRIDRDQFEQLVEETTLPDHWPALDDMIIDDEDRLWISTIVEDTDSYQWWVLEEDGELIARFDWPREKPIRQVRNGNVYTLETDSQDVETVVKYNIKME